MAYTRWCMEARLFEYRVVLGSGLLSCPSSARWTASCISWRASTPIATTTSWHSWTRGGKHGSPVRAQSLYKAAPVRPLTAGFFHCATGPTSVRRLHFGSASGSSAGRASPHSAAGTDTSAESFYGGEEVLLHCKFKFVILPRSIEGRSLQI
jgi:hypothetical protein